MDQDYKKQQVSGKSKCRQLIDFYWFIYSYLFLLYDGIGFFGFAFYKIPRLRQNPPNLLTKFRDPVWVIKSGISYGATLYILALNFVSKETEKMAGIEFVQKPNFTFNLDENLHLFGHMQMSETKILRAYQLYLDI